MIINIVGEAARPEERKRWNYRLMPHRRAIEIDRAIISRAITSNELPRNSHRSRIAEHARSRNTRARAENARHYELRLSRIASWQRRGVEQSNRRGAIHFTRKLTPAARCGSATIAAAGERCGPLCATSYWQSVKPTVPRRDQLASRYADPRKRGRRERLTLRVTSSGSLTIDKNDSIKFDGYETSPDTRA